MCGRLRMQRRSNMLLAKIPCSILEIPLCFGWKQFSNLMSPRSKLMFGLFRWPSAFESWARIWAHYLCRVSRLIRVMLLLVLFVQMRCHSLSLVCDNGNISKAYGTPRDYPIKIASRKEFAQHNFLLEQTTADDEGHHWQKPNNSVACPDRKPETKGRCVEALKTEMAEMIYNTCHQPCRAEALSIPGWWLSPDSSDKELSLQHGTGPWIVNGRACHSDARSHEMGS